MAKFLQRAICMKVLFKSGLNPRACTNVIRKRLCFEPKSERLIEAAKQKPVRSRSKSSTVFYKIAFLSTRNMTANRLRLQSSNVFPLQSVSNSTAHRLRLQSSSVFPRQSVSNSTTFIIEKRLFNNGK